MQNASVAPREAANYFEEIRRFPMLKAEDEYALAVRWRERGDTISEHRVDQPSAPGRKDRDRLPRVRPTDLRFGFGGQYRAYAGHQALRSGQGR